MPAIGELDAGGEGIGAISCGGKHAKCAFGPDDDHRVAKAKAPDFVEQGKGAGEGEIKRACGFGPARTHRRA